MPKPDVAVDSNPAAPTGTPAVADALPMVSLEGDGVTPQGQPQVAQPTTPAPQQPTPQQPPATPQYATMENVQALAGAVEQLTSSVLAQLGQITARLDQQPPAQPSAPQAQPQVSTGGAGDQLPAIERQITDLNARLARQSFLIAEFPELLGLEAQGALPSGTTPDELRPKLTAIKNALKPGAAQSTAGATPPIPDSQNGVNISFAGWDADRVYLRMQELAGRKDDASIQEYTRLQQYADKQKLF